VFIGALGLLLGLIHPPIRFRQQLLGVQTVAPCTLASSSPGGTSTEDGGR
jgi:hypothetical protein